jgi:low temperature requirement protein LtrA
LWQPPRAHGEQPRERVVGPLELFYDLAVVVLVAQAAHHLAGHLTWSGLGEFAAVFTLVWIAWANGSLHHELHGHEDARARSIPWGLAVARRLAAPADSPAHPRS